MISKANQILLIAVIAMSPLTFLRIQIGPTVSVCLLMLLPISASLVFQPRVLMAVKQTFSDFFPFWIGNVFYLAALLTHSVFGSSVVGPNAFIYLFLCLLLCFAVSVQFFYVGTSKRLVALMWQSSLLGAVLLVTIMMFIARQQGTNLVAQFLTLFQGSELVWQRTTMLIFNRSENGVNIPESAVVFKNQVATAVALFLQLSVAAVLLSRSRFKQLVAIGLAILNTGLLLAMLSRGTIVASMIAIAILLVVTFGTFNSSKGLLAGLVCIGFVSLAGLWIAAGQAGALSSKFENFDSFDSRSGQLQEAIEIIGSDYNFVFGTGPRIVSVDYRVHNLPVGSLLEGGVVAFSGAMCQLLFPLFLAALPVLGNRLHDRQHRVVHGTFAGLVVIVSIQAVLRGASGYHDIVSFVVMGVAFGLWRFMKQ